MLFGNDFFEIAILKQPPKIARDVNVGRIMWIDPYSEKSFQVSNVEKTRFLTLSFKTEKPNPSSLMTLFQNVTFEYLCSPTLDFSACAVTKQKHYRVQSNKYSMCRQTH